MTPTQQTVRKFWLRYRWGIAVTIVVVVIAIGSAWIMSHKEPEPKFAVSKIDLSTPQARLAYEKELQRLNRFGVQSSFLDSLKTKDSISTDTVK